jgi:hypothetical protein
MVFKMTPYPHPHLCPQSVLGKIENPQLGTVPVAIMQTSEQPKKEKCPGMIFLLKGDFLDSLFFEVRNTASSVASDSTVSEDAGIEPRTVATLA